MPSRASYIGNPMENITVVVECVGCSGGCHIPVVVETIVEVR
jgi:hypothetical protein